MGGPASSEGVGAGGSRLGLLAVIPAAVFGLTLWAFLSGATPLDLRWAWMPALGIGFSLHIDALSILLILLISGVGTFVFIYAAGYMAGAAHRGRLYLLLLVFMVAMLGAVSADDVYVLFLFWELTSITSFLLVGFKHEYAASRNSAKQALMITGGGGLVMLFGLILLSQIAGSTSLGEILATSEVWGGDSRVWMALSCLFVGAFSKSAQFPFHFWLPGAMAAPTPVSAYLHSATMVKLGVYLLARLHPAFDESLMWQVTLVSVGGFTSVWAMVLTVRERDLKRILAWSTVSALGTLVLLIGLPGQGASMAMAAFLLAHALYKAPLFFVAGNVDLSTGTRIIDALGGLIRRLPFTAVAGLLAAVSMAGIPMSFGYIAKDFIKVAKAESSLFEWVAYSGIFVSAASIAAAGVATVRVFCRTREMKPADAKGDRLLTWLPPLVVASVGIVLGLVPSLVHGLLNDVAAVMGGAGVVVMTEATDALGQAKALAITYGLGLLLFVLWDRLFHAQKRLRPPAAIQPSAWYDAYLYAIPWVATQMIKRMQTGRVRTYVVMVLSFSFLVVGASFALLPRVPLPHFSLAGTPAAVVVVVATFFLVAAAIVVCVVRNSFVMLLISGVIGLASALIFLALGAPDLAFTQFSVEVAFVVVLAAILLRVRAMELQQPPRLPRWQTFLRGGFALGGGLLMGSLVLYTGGFDADMALEAFFSAASVPEAHGRNVVNVILVDFRATDTLGEITVVAFTFLASLPMLRLLREQRVKVLRPGSVLGPSESSPGTPGEVLMLSVAVQVLYPLMLLGAVLILLRGHNEPGGGFIAGMVAVAATAMLAVAHGHRRAIGKLPLAPGRMAALSALLSLLSGVPALIVGQPYLTHLWQEVPLGITSVSVSTVLLFDVGVFGVVWAALGALCAKAIDVDTVLEPSPSATLAVAHGPSAAGRDDEDVREGGG